MKLILAIVIVACINLLIGCVVQKIAGPFQEGDL